MKHMGFEVEVHLEELRREAETYRLINPTRVSLRHWLASQLMSLAQTLEPEIVQLQPE
jgi:hypothetical protein